MWTARTTTAAPSAGGWWTVPTRKASTASISAATFPYNPPTTSLSWSVPRRTTRRYDEAYQCRRNRLQHRRPLPDEEVAQGGGRGQGRRHLRPDRAGPRRQPPRPHRPPRPPELRGAEQRLGVVGRR